ncbi:hypothetical protein KAH94_01795 [bacterium]|nr:hypothetical protein [bacterium]
MNNKPFSEIIDSSLHGFLAQCWQWDDFPTFGQLITVKSGKQTIFGLVHQIQTGSMDPVRYPFPYQKTEEELLREQPQIFEFLKTTFSCLTLGYMQDGKIFYLMTPKPAKIHAFVYPADTQQSKQFFSDLGYLHLLFGNSGEIFNLDELLLALIKQQKKLGIMSQEKIYTFIDQFSLLTGSDYRRLKLFLQRAQPLLEI